MKSFLIPDQRLLRLLATAFIILLISVASANANQEQIVFKLESLGAVYNHPPKKTVFSISQPTRITKIWTYHWNNGHGAMPGFIGLRNARTGQKLGSWDAVATHHMFNTSPGSRWPSRGNGPPWLYWTIQPRIELPPGSYEIIDSDPLTWSTNSEMGHHGVAWVYGIPLTPQSQPKSASDRRKAFILDEDYDSVAEPDSPRTVDKLVIKRKRPSTPAPDPYYEPRQPDYTPPPQPKPPQVAKPKPANLCSNSGGISLYFEHDKNNLLKEIYVHDNDATILVKVAGFPSGRISARLTPAKEYASRNIGTISVSGNRILYKNRGDAFEGTLEVRSVENPDICQTFRFILDVGCLQAGTLVTMADNSYKPIELIKPGETIKAFDTKAQSLVNATVEKVLVHEEITYLLHELTTSGRETLLATGNHPVFTRAGGWKNVDQLSPGDVIYHYIKSSGTVEELPLVSVIRDRSEQGVVYNLKTTRGNYFANDILVHNKCLQQGSMIKTPYGEQAIEKLQPGDLVIGEINGSRQPVRVTNVYTKQTVLKSLPGKRLSDDLTVTINHMLYYKGKLVPAGELAVSDTEVSGTVYDIRTESGNYQAGDHLLQGAE